MYLDGNSILYPARDVKCNMSGKEMVIVRQSTGEFYTLDEVGSLLWEMVFTKPIGLHWLVVALTERYDIMYPAAMKEVIEFCTKLNKENLLFAEQPKNAKKVATPKKKLVKKKASSKKVLKKKK